MYSHNSPQAKAVKTRNLSTSDPLSGGQPEPATVAKATGDTAPSDQDDLFGSMTQPAAPVRSAAADPLATSGGHVSTSSKTSAKTTATKSSPPDDDLFGEAVESGPPVGGKPSAKTTAAKSSPSNDLFGEAVESGPPVGGKPSTKPPPVGKKEVREDKGRGGDHLFSSPEPISEAPRPVSKASPKVPRPKPKSGGLFDDGGSDDDLFATPTQKSGPPVKKPPAGAVPLFDGVDPFAEKSAVADPLGIAGGPSPAPAAAGTKTSGGGGVSQPSGGKEDLFSLASSSETQKAAVSCAEQLVHSLVNSH